jgi:predicted phage gp36 major capsid-like protein
MALYRRLLASTFLHSNLHPNPGVLLPARGVSFAANPALLADHKTTQTEASGRASENSPVEEGQSSIQAEDLTATLNEMAISLEEQKAENEGSEASGFLEQRDTLLEDVEEMAQAATSTMRQVRCSRVFGPSVRGYPFASIGSCLMGECERRDSTECGAAEDAVHPATSSIRHVRSLSQHQ